MNVLNCLKQNIKPMTTHQPSCLWIGCCDARMSERDILSDIVYGNIFVHRNIGNLIKNNDDSLMAVLEHGLNNLQIKKIIIVGHYDCGAVHLAMKDNNDENKLTNWVKPIKDVYLSNSLEHINNYDDKHKYMVKLNIQQQVTNMKNIELVKKNNVQVYGMCYSVSDDKLFDL